MSVLIFSIHTQSPTWNITAYQITYTPQILVIYDSAVILNSPLSISLQGIACLVSNSASVHRYS